MKDRITTSDVVDTLSTTTVSDLARAATTAADRYHLVPQWHRDVFDATIAVLTATANGRTVSALIDRTKEGQLTFSSRFIEEAAGVRGLTTFLPAEQSHELHLYRNTLAFMLGAGALELETSPILAMNTVPNPKGRRLGAARTLLGDEIPPCRLIAWTAVTSSNPRTRTRGGCYVVCEAGLRASEATAVSLNSWDDLDAPTLIRANGLKGANRRDMPLDPFQSEASAAYLLAAAPGRSADVPLLYSGGHAPLSGKASASANGVIGRVFADASLSDPQLTSLSLSNLAAHRAYQAGDLLRARALLGTKGLDQLESRLGVLPDNEPKNIRATPAPRSFTSFRPA